MEEKRKDERIMQSLSTKITLKGFGFFGIVNDLSKGGLGLTSDSLLHEGTVVKLELTIPNHSLMTLIGKVVWRKEFLDKSNKKQRYGIQLIQKPDENELLIPDEYYLYIEEQLTQS